LQVYTDGSASTDTLGHSHAGAGVFWGPGHPLNLAARVPGSQTNNRGELYAVLRAVSSVPCNRPLQIFCDSTYVIHTLCHWVAVLEATGWHCANADLIRPCVELLKGRCARVVFSWVKGHSGNDSHDCADRLAAAGS
ncbi:ribonuclease H-like protein, partial [Auriscalpium vulgare]